MQNADIIYSSPNLGEVAESQRGISLLAISEIRESKEFSDAILPNLIKFPTILLGIIFDTCEGGGLSPYVSSTIFRTHKARGVKLKVSPRRKK